MIEHAPQKIKSTSLYTLQKKNDWDYIFLVFMTCMVGHVSHGYIHRLKPQIHICKFSIFHSFSISKILETTANRISFFKNLTTVQIRWNYKRILMDSGYLFNTYVINTLYLLVFQRQSQQSFCHTFRKLCATCQFFLIEYVTKKIDNFFKADVFRERCNFTLPLLGVDIDMFGNARTERAPQGKDLRSRVMMSTPDLAFMQTCYKSTYHKFLKVSEASINA